MRVDYLVWFGRLVVAVFGIGALALMAAVAVLVRQAEGVPPLPVALGMVGMAALVLLAAASVALVSIAHSARRGAVALERLSSAGPRARGVRRVFSGAGFSAHQEPEPQPEVARPRPQSVPERPNRPSIVARR